MFLNDLGKQLNGTDFGIQLGCLIISAIFFADDLVVIGSSKAKLKKLIRIIKKYFHEHRLTISETKSKVITHDASTGEMTFEGDDIDDISLDQVISFKYLGVPLNCSPYCMFKSFNDQVRQRAQSYLYRVLALVKTGPKRSSLAYTLWNQVALPSILYGTEVLPITKETLDVIEMCQNTIGKFILQIPRSSANVSSYIDAGFRPVWSVIAERTLVYARKTMRNPLSSWTKIAMNECISMGEKNPYTKHLMSYKDKTGVFGMMTADKIKQRVKFAARKDTLNLLNKKKITTFAMSLPVTLKTWFRPKTWVSDSGISKIFAEFRGCNSGLGNRGPSPDGKKYKLCPLCIQTGQVALNNEVIFI